MKKFLFLLFVISGCSPEAQKNTSIDQNWDTYLGDPGRSHFSPLSEITRENAAQLELAWSYDSGEPREGSSTMYTSPLVVNGVLYGLSPKLVAFALDAATGEELWRSDYVGPGAAQRGLMWWEDGGDRRVIYPAGSELIALNADTGQPIRSFGVNGRINLKPEDKEVPFFTSVPGVVLKTNSFWVSQQLRVQILRQV